MNDQYSLQHTLQLIKQQLQVDTTSYIHAVQELNSENYSQQHYKNILDAIVDNDIDFVDQIEAKMTILYFVQTTIKEYQRSPIPAFASQIVNDSYQMAKQLIHDYPWMWSQSEENDTEDNENVVANVGNKLTLSKMKYIYEQNRHYMSKPELIAYIEQTFNSKHSTVQSYFSVCKKLYGPCVDDYQSNKRSKQTKTQKAVEVVNQNLNMDKQQLIQLLEQELNTTAQGARTYYHKAIKQ